MTYHDLHREWRAGRIRFEPDIGEEQIGEASIDLRLGYEAARLRDRDGVVIQPARFIPTDHVENFDLRNAGGSLRIKPREFALAFVYEKIWVPHDMVAAVQGKSSLARAGLAVHITAPHIHPGWHGQLTLEVYNHGPWELELLPKDLVCQVIYYRAETPLQQALAEALGSYVDQKSPFPERKQARSSKATASTKNSRRRK